MSCEESIHRPLEAIKALYSHEKSESDNENSVISHFQQIVNSGVSIPILTDETIDFIPNHSLVRFRGMVQDMLNPEYYVSEYQSEDGSWHTSRFNDELNVPLPPQSRTKLGERRPFTIIPVPGESPWVSQANKTAATASINDLKLDSNSPNSNRLLKRSHPDVPGDMSISMLVSDTTDDTDIHIDDADSLSTMQTATTTSKEKKRSIASQTTTHENGHQNTINDKATDHNDDTSPIPGSYMVYLYQSDDSVQIKLNDVVEVFGILTHLPDLTASIPATSPSMQTEKPCSMTDQDQHAAQYTHIDHHSLIADDDVLATHMPTSLMPRIHAVLMHKEVNPYSPVIKMSHQHGIEEDQQNAHAMLSSPSSSSSLVSAESNAHFDQNFYVSMRARTLGFLSMVFGGDNLVAEYVLLQLVSRVHGRGKENAGVAQVLGTMPLNITCVQSVVRAMSDSGNHESKGLSAPECTSQAAAAGTLLLSPLGEAFAAAVSALTPRCVAIPLSLAKLNGQPWWPRREKDGVRLLSGPLQLATTTQFILDETTLEAGTLTETGLRNLAAVQGMMQHQKVSYEFEFFGLDQPTDAPVTILSTGRTMLKGVGELVVPLAPAAPTASGAESISAALESGGGAESAREYIASVRGMEFSIPDDVAERVQEDLAAAKQKDALNVSVETFHVWLNVARLMALSYGERVLSAERWEQALALEEKRQARLK